MRLVSRAKGSNPRASACSAPFVTHADVLPIWGEPVAAKRNEPWNRQKNQDRAALLALAPLESPVLENPLTAVHAVARAHPVPLPAKPGSPHRIQPIRIRRALPPMPAARRNHSVSRSFSPAPVSHPAA